MLTFPAVQDIRVVVLEAEDDPGALVFEDERPMLTWKTGYPIDGKPTSGWLLLEPEQSRDHFIGGDVDDVEGAVKSARDVVAWWLADDFGCDDSRVTVYMSLVASLVRGFEAPDQAELQRVLDGHAFTEEGIADLVLAFLATTRMIAERSAVLTYGDLIGRLADAGLLDALQALQASPPALTPHTLTELVDAIEADVRVMGVFSEMTLRTGFQIPS